MGQNIDRNLIGVVALAGLVSPCAERIHLLLNELGYRTATILPRGLRVADVNMDQVDCLIVDLSVLREATEIVDEVLAQWPRIIVMAVESRQIFTISMGSHTSDVFSLMKRIEFARAVISAVQPLFQEQQEVPPRDSADGASPDLGALTGRERQILCEIAQGGSSKEIAKRLSISPRTVDVHRARIKEKLNVRRAVDLVRIVCGNYHIVD